MGENTDEMNQKDGDIDLMNEESWEEELEDMLNGIKIKESQVEGYDSSQLILSKFEEKRIHRPWRRGVIVKLLGRWICYKALEIRIKKLWVRKGIINIIDLSHDYYLVAFINEDNKKVTLPDGLWFIYDHYLTMKEWTLEFHPESDSIVNVDVWIRISGLPIEYYYLKVLHAIVDRVGHMINVDKTTTQKERSKYAIVCVEVNISQPLLTMFSIKGKNYKI